MKVVILAGGLGTRLSEETIIKPKPMVEIGGMPILWHIMKIYSTFGFNDFIICLGYKGYIIKEYFANYFLHRSDVTINLKDNRLVVHDSFAEPWNITLIDTGLNTMTGGRIKQIQKHTNGEPFFLTYGDGLSDVNISASLDFHKRNNKLCTVTAVQPSGRFGAIGMDTNNLITTFIEKPKGDGSWINGGFFVCEPGIFNFIQGDASVWEGEPMETLAKSGEMIAYRHDGFWRPMDALRDKIELEELWSRGQAKWKIW
jgi:glucose-1-phosphate cytidylyltransferase